MVFVALPSVGMSAALRCARTEHLTASMVALRIAASKAFDRVYGPCSTDVSLHVCRFMPDVDAAASMALDRKFGLCLSCRQYGLSATFLPGTIAAASMARSPIQRQCAAGNYAFVPYTAIALLHASVKVQFSHNRV